jgi:hypothetical protein
VHRAHQLRHAAYNAGPERVRKWLAGESRLPQETIDYVRVITGHEDMMRPPQLQLLCDRYDLHVESRMLKEGPTPRLAVNCRAA